MFKAVETDSCSFPHCIVPSTISGWSHRYRHRTAHSTTENVNITYCGGRSKRQTQWAWRQASERLLLNRNNKIVSKGDEVSKINRGSGVLVVLRRLWRRGSVLEGRVQVRGGVRRPHTLPSEVRGARGGGFSSGFVYILAHSARRDWHPAFLDPRGHQCACTGKRPVSRGEAHSAYNSGGDEAPFTSGVPHHTPPDLDVFSAPPLSHTHSRREPGEGRRLRDGEMLIIRGRQPTRHTIQTSSRDLGIVVYYQYMIFLMTLDVT